MFSFAFRRLEVVPSMISLTSRILASSALSRAFRASSRSCLDCVRAGGGFGCCWVCDWDREWEGTACFACAVALGLANRESSSSSDKRSSSMLGSAMLRLCCVSPQRVCLKFGKSRFSSTCRIPALHESPSHWPTADGRLVLGFPCARAEGRRRNTLPSHRITYHTLSIGVLRIAFKVHVLTRTEIWTSKRGGYDTTGAVSCAGAYDTGGREEIESCARKHCGKGRLAQVRLAHWYIKSLHRLFVGKL